MAACDRDLTRGGPLHAIRLPYLIQSTIVCFVVRLSEVQTDLLDLYGDGCACDSIFSCLSFRTKLNFSLFDGNKKLWTLSSAAFAPRQ